MGLEGTLDYLVDWMSMARRKKKQLLNTVTLKVRMDCDGCAQKVRNAIFAMKGVRSVDIDLKIQKVTVYGFVEAKKVLKKARSTGKRAEMWPYVPYELMAHPYAAGVYDKKAPANHVRGTDVPGVATLNPVEEKYALMFSNENPNAACSLM